MSVNKISIRENARIYNVNEDFRKQLDVAGVYKCSFFEIFLTKKVTWDKTEEKLRKTTRIFTKQRCSKKLKVRKKSYY